MPKLYSPTLNQLIGIMLQKDPSKRPSINQILKMPIIEKRISMFLDDQDFKDEFSHTLLHNQDVFKAFQKRKEDEDRQRKQLEDMKKKQQLAAEEEKQRKEEEAARKRMEQMYIHQKPASYKPPQSYQSQYQGDEDFFYQQLDNYKQSLQKDIDTSSEPDT